MFPELDLDDVMTEIINTETEVKILGTSFLFDFEKGDFILKDGKLAKANDIQAIQVWIQKIILTEKLKFNIYNDSDYGVTIKDLLGGKKYPLGFISSELQREITEALTQHPQIQGITDFKVERESSILYVSFTVELLNNESFKQEVRFDV